MGGAGVSHGILMSQSFFSLPQTAAAPPARPSRLLTHSANVPVCVTMLIERAAPTSLAICLVIAQAVTSNLINQTDKCSGVTTAMLKCSVGFFPSVTA